MPDKTQLLQTEQQTLKFRLLALLAITAGLYFQRAQVDLLPVVLLVTLYVGYSVGLRYFLLPRLPDRSAIPSAYAMAVVDVGAASGALSLFQLQSPAFILFPLVIIYYAILLGYTGSLVAATLLSLSYAGLAALKGQAQELGSLMAFQVPFLYLLALFTGYLARERFKERETRVALEQLMRMERGTREVLELTRGLQQSLDVRALLRNTMRQAARLVGTDRALALLAQEGHLTVTAAIPEEAGRDGVDEKPARRALAARAPLITADVTPIALGQAVPSLLAVPLLVGSKEMGALYLWHSDAGKKVGPAEVELAQALAELAGPSLAQALAFSEAEERSARVVSELRGSLQGMRRARLAANTPVALGELSLDPNGEEALLSGRKLPLTATEFQLLYVLAQNPGTPLGQERLLREVWGEDFHGQSNVVDVTVHRVRRKLGPRGSRILRTVRGAGYMVDKV